MIFVGVDRRDFASSTIAINIYERSRHRIDLATTLQMENVARQAVG